MLIYLWIVCGCFYDRVKKLGQMLCGPQSQKYYLWKIFANPKVTDF